MRKHVKSVAKVEFGPVAVADSALEVVGRALPRAVVLHSAVHVVRKLVVDVDVVELRKRQVLDKTPAFAAVAADVESAVVALNDVTWRLGRKPKGVVVGVNVAVARDGLPGASAVFGLGHERPKGVNRVLSEGVHVDFAVVERTVADVFGVADAGPLDAAVGAPVKGVFVFVFNQGIDHVGVAGRHREANAAQVAFGQSVF